MNDPDTAAAPTGLTLTDRAVEKVLEFAGLHPEAEGKQLRVSIQGGSKAAYEYGFTFDDATAVDARLQQGAIEVLVDRLSLMYMGGSVVDFVEDLRGSGFVVDNPNLPPLMQDPIARRVNEILEQRISPSVASHGGSVQLIDYVDGRVYVQLGGGCQGCGMVDVTLKQGIEVLLREEIPEVVEVLDTTDHAAGSNPYYSAGK
jgi:Fe/S biogenesis protein NfuA